MLEIRRNFFTFIHSRTSLENSPLFKLSRQRHRIQHFEQYIFSIFWKKYSLALFLVEMEADPDRKALFPNPQKLCGSERIRFRIHKTGPQQRYMEINHDPFSHVAQGIF
jgi:hypothetical protein